MAGRKKLPEDFPVEVLDRELVARGARMPGGDMFVFPDSIGLPGRDAVMMQVKQWYDSASSTNDALSHISTWELLDALMLKVRRENDIRGIWGKDGRKDLYQVADEPVRKNADGVAAICMNDDLTDEGNGFSVLRIKNFGESFNLCAGESFFHQPVAGGPLSTGFLVKEDIIATAGHCADEKNVTALRFVFGYRMLGLAVPVTQMPTGAVYKGKKIVRRVYDRMGTGEDWALVRLDRRVEGQSPVTLSKRGISRNRPVYVIGHPCGLPLKYAPGICVTGNDAVCFRANLDVYSGNSGSPIFDSETHEVIGMVVRGDHRDFRWTGSGWLSVIYPHSRSESGAAQCVRAAAFSAYC